MTARVLDLGAARTRRGVRVAARRAMSRDPDEALTDAALLVRSIERRAGELARDAHDALDLMREVHRYLDEPPEREAR